MSGTLFVVATPIGNLEDITLRALRTLREVAVIAAEDTRRTAKLLAHHGISTPTLSFHEHNARSRMPRLVARLEAGENVAVVTDAGTPGVSDPGVELVQACIDRGIPVDPVPGPSAVMAALVGSGFSLESVTFMGFAPSKASARKRWVSELRNVAGAVVFFEAPHRIRELLTELGANFGDRPIVVARELTKVHQQFLRGTAASILNRLSTPRGEFTIVVGPVPVTADEPAHPLSVSQVMDEFGQLTDTRAFGRRQAIAELARRHARPAREIYALLEEGKKSGS